MLMAGCVRLGRAGGLKLCSIIILHVRSAQWLRIGDFMYI